MIRPVRGAADLREARRLLEQFAASIEIDLDGAAFREELDSLPGPYAPPDGRLLVFEEDGAVAGCIALCNLGDGTGELRRLWVGPLFRGRGIGRALTEEGLREARKIGYSKVRLHTHSSMLSARAVYEGLGFYEIEAYASVPVTGAVFMEREL
ncbi:MAG: GNAT family N-acetyltransferase [Deltaproteobacteria bacterium]|jgi:ribosomal protein S18 acetylase RimI-like enzyme|nr:GNAT family N-acetyltransferase [Deltaproteobacteria bacterium]MBW2414976.1 GNAT family N-acetyltransferase [Deltaproteobacteria bacterium]